MNRRNTFIKALALSVLLATIGATAVVWKGQLAYASESHTYPPTFGVIGITRGQTARINVVNTADIFNPRSSPPAATRLTLKFLNREGRVVAESAENLE